MRDFRFFCLPEALVEVVDIAEFRLDSISGSPEATALGLFSGESVPFRILRVPLGINDSLCGSKGPEGNEFALAFACRGKEVSIFALKVASPRGVRREGGRGGISYWWSIFQRSFRTELGSGVDRGQKV